MPDPSTIRVLAFGSAAALVGWTEAAVPASEAATLRDLAARLSRDCPRLAEVISRVRFAVNQRYAALDAPLAAGDEVALIPPVSGG
ncbi:MAG: MoaD/ThiS family protein [Planctomycetes bacterium]|nr:MoaD/ThiS family protein [Planctomycetota bacterium]